MKKFGSSRAKSKGFTLIELLVVISVIGTLAALLLTNFVGVRGRAADAKRKNDVKQLKSALRLYYNDYQNYPLGSGTLMGCGTDGTSACSSGGAFSAGATTTTYMKELPTNVGYYSSGADEFLLVVTLDNASDQDITTSQTRCSPASRAYYTDGPVSANEYVVCED